MVADVESSPEKVVSVPIDGNVTKKEVAPDRFDPNTYRGEKACLAIP